MDVTEPGKSHSSLALPVPAARAVGKLGHDIRDARRRRIPVAILAQRASINRTTLNKLEKGDPGVSLGSYASGADDAIQSVENKNATATP